MKLAIASAVLAQTLPSAANANDDSATPLLDQLRRLNRLSLTSPTVDDLLAAERKNVSSVGEILIDAVRAPVSKRRGGRMFTGILKNLETLQRNIECDPSSLKEDGDVGILSCGVGRYCAESSGEESAMGGLCMDIPEFGDNRRALQDGDSIITSLQYACDYSYLIGYNCTCDLDDETYSGSAVCMSPSVCTTYPSACGVNSTDCRSDVYTINVDSVGSWETELCVEFTVPYNQKTCYSLNVTDYGKDVSPDCAITFEGDSCASCQAKATTSGNETYPSEVCYEFDCSNTGSGLIGNTCEFPVSTMTLYLDTYGCPPCNLCGKNGTMMSPETSVRVLNNTYQCGYIQDVSLMGFFTDASCQYFSSVVGSPCQCDDGLLVTSNATDVPTVIATYPPTNETAVDVCELCPGGGGIVTPNNLLAVPGESGEISCSELAMASSDGSIPLELCPSVQDLAAVPCCGKEESTPVPEEEKDFLGEVCNPCGPDKEMTKMDGVVSVPMQGLFYCQELAIMGRVAEENEDWCVLIQPFVQTPCACRSTVPTTAPSIRPPTIGFDAAGLQDSANSMMPLSTWMWATGISALVLSLVW